MADKPDHIHKLIFIFKGQAKPPPPIIYKIEDYRPPEKRPA